MSLGDGLVCADKNGLITVWNPGAVSIFGYQPEEMIGQPLAQICALRDGSGKCVPFSILELPPGSTSGVRRQGHGARGIAEITARHFRSKPASPNGRASTDSNMAR